MTKGGQYLDHAKQGFGPVVRRWRSGPDEQPGSQGNRVQNGNKKQSGRQKRTHMTGAELTRIQAELLFAPRDMCRVLRLPRRTYQDYQSGRRGIPRHVAEHVREILSRNREFMARLPDLVHAAVEREFPGGVIPSHIGKGGAEWE